MDYKQENKVEYAYLEEDDEFSDTMYDEIYDNEYDESDMEDDMCVALEGIDLCTNDLYADTNAEPKENSLNQELQSIFQLEKEPQIKQEGQSISESENDSQSISKKTVSVDRAHLVANPNYQYTSDKRLEKEYFESLRQDNSMQMLLVGNKYLIKNESEQDLERAVNCYTSASFLNNGFAQFNLAYCYYHGLGVPKNKEIAHLLVKRSLENVDGIIKPNSTS